MKLMPNKSPVQITGQIYLLRKKWDFAIKENNEIAQIFKKRYLNPWTKEETDRLKHALKKYGTTNFNQIVKHVGGGK